MIDQAKSLPISHHLMFGLSADPIHRAHSDILIGAVKSLYQRGFFVEDVWIVPVYRRNPVGQDRKEGLPETFEQRLTICKIAAVAIAEALTPCKTTVTVSAIARDLAENSDQPNYDVHTLAALIKEGENWLYLLSSELLSGEPTEVSRWHEPQRLVRLARLVIANRPGYPINQHYLSELESEGARAIILDELPQSRISATAIRERLIAGEDPLTLADEDLLDKAVAQYIRKNNYYRDDPTH